MPLAFRKSYIFVFSPYFFYIVLLSFSLSLSLSLSISFFLFLSFFLSLSLSLSISFSLSLSLSLSLSFSLFLSLSLPHFSVSHSCLLPCFFCSLSLSLSLFVHVFFSPSVLFFVLCQPGLGSQNVAVTFLFRERSNSGSHWSGFAIFRPAILTFYGSCPFLDFP